jgi:hypothetical protein
MALTYQYLRRRIKRGDWILFSDTEYLGDSGYRLGQCVEVIRDKLTPRKPLILTVVFIRISDSLQEPQEEIFQCEHFEVVPEEYPNTTNVYSVKTITKTKIMEALTQLIQSIRPTPT